MRARFLSTVAPVLLSDKHYRVELLKEGEYLHPAAPNGVLPLTSSFLKEIYDNFKAGVRGKKIPANRDHDDPLCKKARAWCEDMEYVEKGKDGKAHLYGKAEIVDDEVLEDVKSKRLQFVSPELVFNWSDPADKGKKKNVMKAFAFTNMPHIKGMEPFSLALAEGQDFFIVELSEKPDGDEQDYDDEGVRTDQDESGRESGENLEDAIDRDAQDAGLPDQCKVCRRLFDGECPFQGIPVKQAAADLGNCPQFEDVSVLRSSSSGITGGQEAQMTDQELKALIDQAIAGVTVTLTEKFGNAQADSDAKIVALQETITQQKATIDTLGSKAAEVDNLKEQNIRLSEGNLIAGWVESGKLTPAGAKIAEKLLQLGRGKTVKLSDEQTEADTQNLLAELMETIEVPADRSDVESVHNRRNGDEENVQLSERAELKAKELAKEDNFQRGDWQKYYGDAIRSVARGGK